MPAMTAPSSRLRPALKALGCSLVSVALLATAAPAGAAVVTPTPALKRLHGVQTQMPKLVLKRGEKSAVHGNNQRRAGTSTPTAQHATAADGSTVSVVPDPPDGPAKSTWQVTYTGFTGTTGTQAQAAFQRAVNIWASIVTSSVPIKVSATFATLDQYVLGSANPCIGYSDGSSIYASALADALSGADQAQFYSGAPSCDIEATFSNDPSAGFYFGTDGLPLTDQVDFESVVLHELGHGLGFAGSMDVTNGVGSYYNGGSQPYIFDRFAYDALTAGSLLLSQPNNSTALATKLQSGAVYWGGSAATSANGGIRPKLYAPGVWEGGSSFSHVDEDAYPTGDANSLMTPYVYSQETVHNPGAIMVGMFTDMGWTASIPPPVAPGAPTAVTAAIGNAQSAVHWTAPAGSGTGTSYTVTASPGGATCGPTFSTTCTVTALTNGTAYTFTVRATNNVGTSPASTASAPVTPDGTAPTVTSGALAAVSLSNPVLAFSGTDAGSGIAYYNVTYKIAPWNANFASPVTFSTTATSRTIGVNRGSTICFTAVARDRAGNTSAASAQRCTTVPLDDRSLARSSGWGSVTSSAYFAGTATTIAHVGSTLTRTGVQTRRISLVATRCSTCGVVGVYWNGTLLRQISLKTTSGTYQRQVIVAYDLGSVRPGTLVIKTMNGSRVYIDGVGLGRF